MKMRRVSFLFALLVMAVLSGCGNHANNTSAAAESSINSAAGGNVTAAAKALPNSAGKSNLPKVYMTKDISGQGVMKAYQALNRPAVGKAAIKIHMGEPGNKNYLKPELAKELTQSINGTFVDSNTYYGGSRAHTAGHLQAAKDHGYTYAPIDILDADGEIKLPITNGKRLKEAIIGSHYANYDFIVSVTHFKGHSMAGFGGTFKNLAVGMASVNGKGAIHSEPSGGKFSSTRESFFEKIVEYTKAVIDDKGDNIVYINVLNNLSVDCDCAANAAHPEMADIGILASLDPVALDKASLDLIYKAPENERRHLVERIESRNGIYQLVYAEQLGLGSQQYELVALDG